MTAVLKIDNELDNELCEKACNLGGHSTPAEAIQEALERYVCELQLKKFSDKSYKIKSVIDLFGQIDYYDDYDYKKLRV